MTAPLADRIRAVLALAEKAADGSDDHRCPNCGCYTNKAVEAIGRDGAQPMLQCEWCSTTWNRGARMEWSTPTRTEMAALLMECLADDGWLPIEECPLNEPRLLYSHKLGTCRIDRWGLYHIHNDPQFTHFRPLPAAPGAEPPDACRASEGD